MSKWWVALAVVALPAGCGSSDEPTAARNKPQDALRGFADPKDQIPDAPKYRSGACAKLVQRVVAARSQSYPWYPWKVESVRIARDGRSADAVTPDGSAGLHLVDGEWRVAWAHDQ